MKKLQKIYQYYIPVLKTQRKYIYITFISYVIFSVLANSVIPLFYKNLIDAINAGDSVSEIYILLASLFGCYIIYEICMYFALIFLSKFESVLARELNGFSYDNFIKHSYSFFADNSVGSLVDKSLRLGKNAIRIIDAILFQYIGAFIGLGSMIIILFFESSILGGLFLIFSIIYTYLSIFFAKRMDALYRKRSEANSKLSSSISDIMTNILAVKTFAGLGNEKDEFEKDNEIQHISRLAVWLVSVRNSGLLTIVSLSFRIIVLVAGIYFWSKSIISVGTLVLMVLYITNIMDYLRNIGRSIIDFQSNISDCIEAIEIIEKHPEVIDPDYPEVVKISQGNISFNDITFKYPDGADVFDNFTLEIPEGQSVGIVGASGSGKTTIAKLLLRFYDVQSGFVQIDGQDIKNIKQDDLRLHIAYIPQESILFHRSIYENILYGNTLARKDQVIAAAEFAHADEFISNLADGYDTLVGDRGVKLSGGQRQRIAIARAMLKDSPILLMDEATSALDSLSEQYIQDSFSKLMKGRTTIVIAHRLSTIQKMDRIIVLKEGKIVEDGSHEELLISDGYYAELWKSQQREEAFI